MKSTNRKKTTIREIVKDTGLSIGCVSNYLNGKGVRQENREKIENSINKLGFKVDLYARGFSNGATHTIGVIIPSFANAFYGLMLSELSIHFNNKNYEVIANEHNNDSQKEKEIINNMLARRIEGIVIVPATHDKQNYEDLDPNKIIFADIFIEGLPEFDFVVLDNYDAGRMACELFCQLGHTQLAVIYNDANSYTGKERKNGFLEHAQKVGANVDCYPFHDNLEAAYLTASNVCAEKKYTGIFASNYIATLGMIFHCNENDLRLPNEFSFIGFDNLMLTELFKPTLTIINQPLKDISNKIVEQLLKRRATKTNVGSISTIKALLINGKTINKLN